ncbi:MAG TPA: HAMP domain-containing sensor histidine kinase [Saprospiraceae bacterium]|nr:HAMP domain-containing sensor histidine kinase [Saprospiraceae bacterium]
MFLLATGALVGILLISVFFLVKGKVLGDLDELLKYEALKHTAELKVDDGTIMFANKAEMLEREHREADANPVFVQLVDIHGKTVDKSPNLKEAILTFDPAHKGNIQGQYTLNNRRIRQTQVVVTLEGKSYGYIVTAVSSENAEQLIASLRNHFFWSFPIILLILFLVTRFLADRSIQPIKQIISTSNTITSQNLDARIALPEQKDELHELTTAINALLGRIHKSIDREKQFTSDAAHELKTPLAVLKGTLEVLVRKPRTTEEYHEKIHDSIKEIDRLNDITEQLLILARIEHDHAMEVKSIELNDFIADISTRFHQQLQTKSIQLHHTPTEKINIKTNTKLLQMVIENLLSNAIKYSDEGKNIYITTGTQHGKTYFKIQDEGFGIATEEIQKIFNPFYRAHALTQKGIKGTGLGLSIVQKACDQLGVSIDIQSRIGEGTEVRLEWMG